MIIQHRDRGDRRTPTSLIIVHTFTNIARFRCDEGKITESRFSLAAGIIMFSC